VRGDAEWRAVRGLTRHLSPASGEADEHDVHPELGRLELYRATVHVRAAPHRLGFWLRWIDHWIPYANSIVEE
jgi:hypothetical protein